MSAAVDNLLSYFTAGFLEILLDVLYVGLGKLQLVDDIARMTLEMTRDALLRQVLGIDYTVNIQIGVNIVPIMFHCIMSPALPQKGRDLKGTEVIAPTPRVMPNSWRNFGKPNRVVRLS